MEKLSIGKTRSGVYLLEAGNLLDFQFSAFMNRWCGDELKSRTALLSTIPLLINVSPLIWSVY